MAQQSARIVREVHDEPHVAGTRITVRWLYARVHERGLHPKTVAERHDLDVADVYHALAYYHDHPDEMAAVDARRDRAVAAARNRSTVEPPE